MYVYIYIHHIVWASNKALVVEQGSKQFPQRWFSYVESIDLPLLNVISLQLAGCQSSNNRSLPSTQKGSSQNQTTIGPRNVWFSQWWELEQNWENMGWTSGSIYEVYPIEPWKYEHGPQNFVQMIVPLQLLMFVFRWTSHSFCRASASFG